MSFHPRAGICDGVSAERPARFRLFRGRFLQDLYRRRDAWRIRPPLGERLEQYVEVEPACRGPHPHDRRHARATTACRRSGPPSRPHAIHCSAQDDVHHVQEEKKPGTGIFAKAKEGGIATPELAKRLVERTQELMEEANAGALGPPETRSFRVRTNAGMKPASQEHNTARGSSSNHGTRARRARALRQRRRPVRYRASDRGRH